mmetsp:Transcript_86233/g.180427  ORF Transcript_86233/g.180427 Transcript_86233/m.180427 type:complete len:287 (-) Transcript_86233:369-1229(-)
MMWRAWPEPGGSPCSRCRLRPRLRPRPRAATHRRPKQRPWPPQPRPTPSRLPQPRATMPQAHLGGARSLPRLQRNSPGIQACPWKPSRPCSSHRPTAAPRPRRPLLLLLPRPAGRQQGRRRYQRQLLSTHPYHNISNSRNRSSTSRADQPQLVDHLSFPQRRQKGRGKINLEARVVAATMQQTGKLRRRHQHLLLRILRRPRISQAWVVQTRRSSSLIHPKIQEASGKDQRESEWWRTSPLQQIPHQPQLVPQRRRHRRSQRHPHRPLRVHLRPRPKPRVARKWRS